MCAAPAARALAAGARRTLLLSAIVGLGGCAALFGPRSIDVARAQLEERVARQFPVTRRYLEVFDVTVRTPRLTLLPETNRIGTELDLTTSERLTGRSWRGALAMNYRLRFEPLDHSVRLADVRVERLHVDGVPAALQLQVNRLGALLGEEVLNGQPLHVLRADDVRRMQQSGLVPGELVVTAEGLSIPLLPSR